MALVSPPDAAFLFSESRATPMHVGGLQVFELPDGEGPGWLRDQYALMLAHDDVSPLFRKRPHRSLRTGGQWMWRDDEQLDLEYHVRHSALPEPGRVRELLALGSRLHGSLLDRQRPLWEFCLIEGLEGNRFAVYTKIHHALVDGVSSLRLLERSLTTDPRAEAEPPWTYRPRRRDDDADGSAPNPVDAALDTAIEVVRSGRDLVTLAPSLVRTARRAMDEELAAFPFKAPSTMLNVHITGARRFAAQSWSLPRMKAAAKAAGCTLNDLVLAMCSGALRRYLEAHGELPKESLTAMVPVSLRVDDSAGGNAVGAVLTSLATATADPGQRLSQIRASMEIAKDTLRGLSPVQMLAVSAANMMPSPIMSMLGGGEGLRPPFNVTISNVPGPRQPLYLNGAKLQGVYPMSIPYHGQALNITITSYVDNLEFGLTGCRRRVPHLQRLLDYLEVSLTELEAAVEGGVGPVAPASAGLRPAADQFPAAPAATAAVAAPTLEASVTSGATATSAMGKATAKRATRTRARAKKSTRAKAAATDPAAKVTSRRPDNPPPRTGGSSASAGKTTAKKASAGKTTATKATTKRAATTRSTAKKASAKKAGSDR
ncbi:MAG: wax ester/triacylglycerol synthase family O-acyltransferase [Acidimicrobiia bacterium]|nr:wax ester/triacylglycerol synthase family O-acyltransferase [Acidimicrobiia bacterium]